MSPRILVVDDDDALRYTLRALFEDEGWEVDEAQSGQVALDLLGESAFDLIVSDLKMPGIDGFALLDAVLALPRAPRLVLVTAHGSERTAALAMKRGALDYFAKPFDPDEVVAVVRRAVAYSRLPRDAAVPGSGGGSPLDRELVYRAPAMERLAQWVARVAPRDVTVLITGESGTGKEGVARAIVAGSRRANRPFVRFNCAALPPELAEADLFGHNKGAFTGAARSRLGLFREADGGTLLLDEIGELDPRTQGALLRALQEGEVRPLGEDQPVKVDVRILAATNQNLAAAVEAGRFRRDLYYRLNVVLLHVPPLRDRPEDIEPLAEHFARTFGQRFGVGEVRLSPFILGRLKQWSWKGNVRELEHVIERMVVLSAGPVLDQDPFDPGAAGEDPEALLLKERVARFERDLIADMLARCEGNQSEAARRMGVSRVTLIDKIRRYGLR